MMCSLKMNSAACTARRNDTNGVDSVTRRRKCMQRYSFVVGWVSWCSCLATDEKVFQ